MNRPKSYVPAPLNLNVDVRGEVKHDLYHSRCPIRAHLPSTILSIRGLGGSGMCLIKSCRSYIMHRLFGVLITNIVEIGQLLDTWSVQYDSMIYSIDEIIAKLC